MSERVLTQQSFSSLLLEIQDALEKLDLLYPRVLEALQALNPHFDLTQPLSLSNDAQKLWKDFEKQLQLYCSHLERLVSAYQDLSADLQNFLSGNRDSSIQELSRQGEILAEDIRIRQEAARLFLQLYELLKKITSQKKASALQQSQVKDVLFGLEILNR